MTKWQPLRKGWTPSVPGCTCTWTAPDDYTWIRTPDVKCGMHRGKP